MNSLDKNGTGAGDGAILLSDKTKLKTK